MADKHHVKLSNENFTNPSNGFYFLFILVDGMTRLLDAKTYLTSVQHIHFESYFYWFSGSVVFGIVLRKWTALSRIHLTNRFIKLWNNFLWIFGEQANKIDWWLLPPCKTWENENETNRFIYHEIYEKSSIIVVNCFMKCNRLKAICFFFISSTQFYNITNCFKNVPRQRAQLSDFSANCSKSFLCL